MRIALLHPFSWPEVRRGAERYVDDLGAYLSTAGHDVTVLTGTTGRPTVARVNGGPLVVRRRHRLTRRLQRRGIGPVETFGLVALPSLARGRFDVVHALVPAAVLAARLARHATVFTVLGQPDPADLAAEAFGGSLTRAAVRRATAVAALSGAAAERVRQFTGREAAVLPPGVRLDAFPPDLQPRAGPPRILFSADAGDPRKGLDLLLAAMPMVLERVPDARLLLSGPGDPSAALQRLGGTRALVEPAVDVLGVGEPGEVPARYRSATVTVLPSRDEAFGLALVESLASGTPVVGTAAGGIPEIVSDPAVGRTFPPGDADALARALDEAIVLARDPGTPGRCAAHAQVWSWSQVGLAHERLYAEVTA